MIRISAKIYDNSTFEVELIEENAFLDPHDHFGLERELERMIESIKKAALAAVRER
jgi:hypothetical protein